MSGTSRGVVATGHPLVSQAAADVLRAGGNAFDAAVAAGFAAAVAEPMFTSLGGGGFLLARTADGRGALLDFFVDTPGSGLDFASLEPHFTAITVHFPSSDQIFNVGLGSVAVPGALHGLLHAHERLGRIPLREVVAPARDLARAGVVLNAHQAYGVELLLPIISRSEVGRHLYAPGGRAPREGDRIVNPELAGFLLELPAGGARDFYEGALARRVADEMREGGGLLTARDLAAYRTRERVPLAADYHGLRLLTNPPPSFGGTLVAGNLRLLERADLSGIDWGSGEHLRRLVESMVEIERLRRETPPSGARSTGGTTHISVRDKEGNAASMTLSNGEGSGYFVPGTGIMLNNMLGEDDLHPEGFHTAPPGVRVASMMAPSMVLEDGDVRLIVGSGGSKRIRTVLVQVVSSIADFGLSVSAAVEAPRVHWDGECVQVEPGFTAAAVEALAERWPVNVWTERNLYFGGAHAVAGGSAAGDPRRGGAGLVV